MVASASGSASRWLQVRAVAGQPVVRDDHPRVRRGQSLAPRRPRSSRTTRIGQGDSPRTSANAPPAAGVLDQQHLDGRVLEDVGGVVRPVVRVERDRHQPERQGGLVEHHPLRAVAQQHRRPGRRATAPPPPGPPASAPPASPISRQVEFAPAAVALEVAIGDPVRGAPDPLQEEPVQGPGALHRDQILGPSTHGNRLLLAGLPAGLVGPGIGRVVTVLGRLRSPWTTAGTVSSPSGVCNRGTRRSCRGSWPGAGRSGAPPRRDLATGLVVCAGLSRGGPRSYGSTSAFPGMEGPKTVSKGCRIGALQHRRDREVAFAMQIFVNGSPTELEDASTHVRPDRAPGSRRPAHRRGGQRGAGAAQPLRRPRPAPGDRVEIIHAVGGG